MLKILSIGSDTIQYRYTDYFEVSGYHSWSAIYFGALQSAETI